MPPSASTRDRLLATAGELFYDHGIAATGVDAVVRESGVSKPTLYAQFGSKSELVAAVLERRHAERSAELRGRVEGVEDVRERPLAVFDWLADWYRRAGARGCGFLNAAAELPDPDDVARLVVTREKRWLLGFLCGLAREAGLREPERLGSQLLLLIDGVAGRVVASGAEAAAAAVEDAMRAARILVAAASEAPASRGAAGARSASGEEPASRGAAGSRSASREEAASRGAAGSLSSAAAREPAR